MLTKNVFKYFIPIGWFTLHTYHMYTVINPQFKYGIFVKDYTKDNVLLESRKMFNNHLEQNLNINPDQLDIYFNDDHHNAWTLGTLLSHKKPIIMIPKHYLYTINMELKMNQKEKTSKLLKKIYKWINSEEQYRS